MWREKLASKLFGIYPFYFVDPFFVEKVRNAAEELNINFKVLTKPGLIRHLLTEEEAEKLYRKLYPTLHPRPQKIPQVPIPRL